MSYVTFLGPYNATFSHEAYNVLAKIHGTPEADLGYYMPVNSNDKILRLMIKKAGYGTVAIDTLAEGRVDETFKSFTDLLNVYKNSEELPFHVVGAIQMKIRFCLMTRQGTSVSAIKKIIAHEKALGACKGNIKQMNVKTVAVSSNGEAAKLIFENELYRNCAALGPQSAADKFGLKVINDSFEDKDAITTFFQLAPKSHAVLVGDKNRALIVFKLRHTPGALVEALVPFELAWLNLIQIHSVYAGNRTYHFVIELEIDRIQLTVFNTVMNAFSGKVNAYLCFGPFEVGSE